MGKSKLNSEFHGNPGHYSLSHSQPAAVTFLGTIGAMGERQDSKALGSHSLMLPPGR